MATDDCSDDNFRNSMSTIESVIEKRLWRQRLAGEKLSTGDLVAELSQSIKTKITPAREKKIKN